MALDQSKAPKVPLSVVSGRRFGTSRDPLVSVSFSVDPEYGSRILHIDGLSFYEDKTGKFNMTTGPAGPSAGMMSYMAGNKDVGEYMDGLKDDVAVRMAGDKIRRQGYDDIYKRVAAYASPARKSRWRRLLSL
jgi:hypothetical protein